MYPVYVILALNQCLGPVVFQTYALQQTILSTYFQLKVFKMP